MGSCIRTAILGRLPSGFVSGECSRAIIFNWPCALSSAQASTIGFRLPLCFLLQSPPPPPPPLLLVAIIASVIADIPCVYSNTA